MAPAKPGLAREAGATNTSQVPKQQQLERQEKRRQQQWTDRRRNTHTYNKHTMWPSLIAGLALLASQAQALYFYIDGPSQKCFFEELPKDTLVVGMQQRTT